MRFLADENIPGRLVEALRLAGHDVAWARLDCAGADDRAVLVKAVAEQRIVVTFDKDFGELAARSGLSAPSGVILIRLSLARPADTIRRIATLIDARPDWAGHVAVIEPGRLRLRLLDSPHPQR
jgi:predicted nuclease of predicted toxin-antitoxin system